METLQKSARSQYTACFIVNILSFSFGVILKLFSETQIFEKNETSTPRTPEDTYLEEQYGRLTKFYFIGGTLGVISFGFLANIFGRKKAMISIAVCFLLSHLINISTGYFHYLFIGQFIRGFGCAGIFIIVPMYISEIAEDDIRGVLCSYFYLFISLGVFFSVVSVYMFPSRDLEYLGCILSVIFLASSVWLPESPTYYLLKNRNEEALNSLIKLRGRPMKLVENELENLAPSVPAEGTRISLITGIVLLDVRHLCSINWITHITEKLINESKFYIPYTTSTSIVSLLQVVGAIIATAFVERAGRKVLLLVSSVGMAFALSFYILWFLVLSYVKESHFDLIWLQCIHWLLISSNAVYIVSFHLGFGSITWVLFAEIFQGKSRGPAISLCVLVFWAFYILDYYFSLQLNDFRMVILAINGVLSAMLIVCFLPETKGKPIENVFKTVRK